MKEREGEKLTVRSFARMKRDGVKITALTAYDAPTARFAEKCGVDLVLVGDSLGMTVLGYETTIPVTLEQSLHHCAAAARGADKAFVVGDMPFMTYQTSLETAMLNAARYLQEAGADAVKLEGGANIAETVAGMTAAGIPVLGHVGLLPQRVKTAGGYRLAGKTKSEADNLLDDARALQEAGAFAVVLEGIPAKLAEKITADLDIPTIGIGAGAECDGQIQVVNDILGLFSDFTPKHTKRYADLDVVIEKALKNYADDVRNGRFPSDTESF
jgi:3-methyl-2-oxobutanoate hydroxymethyltransferase